MVSFNTSLSVASLSNNLQTHSALKTNILDSLTTGKRINTAKDDSSGLSLSEKLTSRMSGSDIAMRNISEGIDYLMTVDSMLETAVEGFQILREKTVLSMNHDNKWNPPSSNEVNWARGNDFQRFYEELEDTMQRLDVTGKEYLNPGEPLIIQIGSEASDTMEINIGDMSYSTLFSTHGSFLRNWNASNARQTQPNIDAIIDTLSSKRGEVGAAINALSHQYSALSNQINSTEQAVSRIRNVNFALATAQLSSIQIKEQASIAVFAQASTLNESISLKLIRG